jgi:hypothetical protein
MTTDVIISWFGAVPAATLALFTRKPRVIPMPLPHDDSDPKGQHYGDQFQLAPSAEHPWVIGGWPHPLAAILRRYGVTDPGRICVFGFSQGCQGVLQMLKSQDAGYIEHAMMFDGLHCSWYPGTGPNEGRSNIASTCLGVAVAAAVNAAKGPIAIGTNPPGQHYFTLTHSSIIPPTFPSTTDTAREVMARVWDDPPDVVLPPGTIGATFNPPWIAKGVSYVQDTIRYTAGQNGLTILGYNNIDPTGVADHIYQGNVVLKTMLDKLLVPRWNGVDTSLPTCSVASGSGQAGDAGAAACNPVAPVVVPGDYFKTPVDASLDWLDYVPEVSEPSEVNVAGVVLSAAIGAGVALGIKELYDFLKRRWAR